MLFIIVAASPLAGKKRSFFLLGLFSGHDINYLGFSEEKCYLKLFCDYLVTPQDARLFSRMLCRSLLFCFVFLSVF